MVLTIIKYLYHLRINKIHRCKYWYHQGKTIVHMYVHLVPGCLASLILAQVAAAC